MSIFQEEEKLQSRFSLLDYIPIGICILQEDFKVIFWNKCLENWTKISRQEILNQKIETFFPHLIKPKYYSRIQQVLKGAPATIFSSQLHKHLFPSALPNNNLRIQHTIVTNIPRLDGQGYYAMIVVQDVTELTNRIQEHKIMRDQALIEINYRKKIEEQLSIQTNKLQQKNLELSQLYNTSKYLQNCENFVEAYLCIKNQAQLLFPNLIGGIFCADQQGKINQLINWGNIEIEDQNLICQECILVWQKNIVKEKQSKFPQPQCCYFELRSKDKSLGIMYLATNNPEGIEESQRIFAINFAEQISLILANLSLRQNLYEMTITDTLTGLYNRRYLDDILEKEISRAQRNNRKIGIIMIDIDYFKKINDTFGHQAGDITLMSISNLIKQHIRKSDCACRYGGEELTIILPEISIYSLKERAEFLRIAIKNLQINYRDNLSFNITASFGVASFPEHGLTSQALLRAADTALYRAKQEGRDRVILA